MPASIHGMTEPVLAALFARLGTAAAVAAVLGCTPATARSMRWRLVRHGFDVGKRFKGRPPTIRTAPVE